MRALVTDLYQLTMAAGYFQAGKTSERATFELFVRSLPANRNFLVAAGLEQAVEYLLELRFTGGEIDYLRGLRQFQRASPAFFEALREFRFTGDLSAAPEGTPIFAGEPLVTVRAPLMEAQIPETYLLATVGFQTMIATKAARIVEVARPASVIEFGTRRAHSPEAGVLAGRAAYIGGCIGTSNVEAGKRFGVPVFGTAAHSWVMSFTSEMDAFRELQKLLGESSVYLVDSYDTLEGTRRAASLGKPMWGVRLDSGNLVELSRAVRAILDQAGLGEAKVMASGDMDEYKILELTASGVPIDAFGVGTSLATSSDCPSIGAVYKMAELERRGEKRYTAKFSEDKHTMPAAKQVFRCADHDIIAGEWESPPCPGAQALLQPVIAGGKQVSVLPGVRDIREHAAASIGKLPRASRSLYPAEEAWRVEYSRALTALQQDVRQQMPEVKA